MKLTWTGVHGKAFQARRVLIRAPHHWGHMDDDAKDLRLCRLALALLRLPHSVNPGQPERWGTWSWPGSRR
jgi:hypothetical protein